MNIFSAFSFGKIIKIVLPGFIVLIGVILLVDAGTQCVINKHLVFSILRSNTTFLVFSSIPLILVFGMTCNTLFFVYFSDRWFVKWFRAVYPDISDLKKKVFEELEEKFIEELNVTPELKKQLIPHADLAGLLLKRFDLSHFYFLQESYWYYFEYHVNMLLAVLLLFLAIPVWCGVEGLFNSLSFNHMAIISICYLMTGGYFAVISVKAAKANYYKFQLKLISYFVSIDHSGA